MDLQREGVLSLGDPPLPTVLLRHELPDGSAHVDWMLARDARAALPLICFRLPAALHELAAGARMAAERIADHRPVYLEFEGEISDGRGVVTRLARGSIVSLQPASSQVAENGMKVTWMCAERIKKVQIVRVKCENSSQWTVFCDSMERG